MSDPGLTPVLPRSLPQKPNREQLKKQAKELLERFRASEWTADAGVRQFERNAHPSQFVLNDAQRVLARAYGFESWPKLKAFVDGATIARFADAVKAGDMAQVRSTLASRPELVSMDRAGNDEHRGLHYAVLNRNAPMVKLLSGCAGTYPSRAQRIRVRASIRMMAAASVASKILNLRTALRASIGGSFGEFIGLICSERARGFSLLSKFTPQLYDLIARRALEAGIAPREKHHVTTAEQAAQLVHSTGGVAFLTRAGAWRVAVDGLTLRALLDSELYVKTVVTTHFEASRLVSEFIRTFVRKAEDSGPAAQQTLFRTA